MHKIAFWPILGVLLVFMLALTAGLALAQVAPFHPGEALFPLQYEAEQTLVRLTNDPGARAQTLLDLLERHTANLEWCQGKDDSHSYFDMTLLQALAAVSASPEHNSASLRTRAMAVLAKSRDALDRLDGTNKGFQNEREVILSSLRVLADLSHPLSDLLTVGDSGAVQAAAVPETPAAQVTPTSAPLEVAPRRVVFPAGSPGALHAFYALTGKHAARECGSCHTGLQYDGLPTTCQDCHSPKIPANHYPGECTLCHTTGGWTPAKFNHSLPMAADCLTCHIKSRPAQHWDGQCSACHSTAAWKPATFNHAAAKATDCISCHQRNKPANHWNGQCSQCHSTSAWKPATFNHAAAGATDCVSCHQSKKPANHWAGQCSACHSTSAWKPANFNHAAAGASDCQSCHSGRKPANHWAGQCSACHNTNAWKPASFNHAVAGATNCISCHSGSKPAGHWTAQCSSCHSTTAWKPANFNHAAAGATDCQSCHAAKRPANHFQGQCSQCHSTSAWKPANFNHPFPMSHGGAKGNCSACHTNNGSGPADCFKCHNRAELDKKHAEKKITNYASRCLDCHKNP